MYLDPRIGFSTEEVIYYIETICPQFLLSYCHETHLFLLLLNELLLTQHPEVVEVVGVSVELEPIFLVIPIWSELVQVRRRLASPAIQSVKRL